MQNLYQVPYVPAIYRTFLSSRCSDKFADREFVTWHSMRETSHARNSRRRKQTRDKAENERRRKNCEQIKEPRLYIYSSGKGEVEKPACVCAAGTE